MRKCGYNADTAETKREWRHSRTTAKRQRKRKASLLFQPSIRFGDIDRIHLDVSPTYESFSPRNRSSSPRQPPQTCGLSERELIAHTCSPSQRRRAGVLCVVDLGPVSFALSLSLFLSLSLSLFSLSFSLSSPPTRGYAQVSMLRRVSITLALMHTYLCVRTLNPAQAVSRIPSYGLLKRNLAAKNYNTSSWAAPL